MALIITSLDGKETHFNDDAEYTVADGEVFVIDPQNGNLGYFPRNQFTSVVRRPDVKTKVD